MAATLTLLPDRGLAACPGSQPTCSPPPSVHTPAPVPREQAARRRGLSLQLEQPSSPPLSSTPSPPLPPEGRGGGGRYLSVNVTTSKLCPLSRWRLNHSDLLNFLLPIQHAHSAVSETHRSLVPAPTHASIIGEIGTAIISTRHPPGNTTPVAGNTTPFLAGE